MKELSRDANLITPNLTEACLLADIDITKAANYSDSASMLAFAGETASRLRALAFVDQDVVITGIKCRNDAAPFICNITATANGVHESRSPFFDRSFSGTGDLLASVLCGCRLNGMCTEDAVNLAGRFLYHSIADTMQENGAGNAGVNFEKYLIELIMEGTNYNRESSCTQ